MKKIIGILCLAGTLAGCNKLKTKADVKDELKEENLYLKKKIGIQRNRIFQRQNFKRRSCKIGHETI